MLTSLKHILFCNLFLFCVTYLYSQNTSSDYIPSQLISYGLNAPGRMAVDTMDNIYVVDAVQRNILKFNAEGNYINSIETNIKPVSIAISTKNKLFVGDKNTGNIYTVEDNGTKTMFYSGLSFPASMEFGSNNILYVVDSKQKKVIGLDVSGYVVKDFTYSSFTYPTGIAYDAQNNNIIVSEHGGIGEDVQYCYSGSWQVSSWGPLTSIYIFDLEGNLINQFGCFGTKDGEFQRIQGIKVGPCGNIYATDPYLGRVSVFEANGNYITNFGTQGNGLGELNIPTDIVFGSDNRAFISSMNKGTVDVFSITSPLPTATIKTTDKIICTGSTTDITVAFTGVAPWTFTYTVDDSNPVQIIANETPFNISADLEGLYKINALTDGTGAIGTCFTGSALISVSTELPTVTITTDVLEKCSDDPTGIELEFTGIAPFTFTHTINGLNLTEITTLENNYILDAQKSGLYEITAFSDAGCSGTSIIGNTNVTVYPLPTSLITNGNDRITLKPGELAEINIVFTGTPPWSFIYAIDGLNPISITTNESPYVLKTAEEGTYEVLETQDAYCQSKITDGYPDIVIDNTPDIVTAILETDTKYICIAESRTLNVDLTGTAPWTFGYTIDGVPAGEITTDETPYQLITSTPGIYALSSIIDGFSNPGIFSGSAVVIENPTPIIDLPNTLMLCEGSSVELNPGDFESFLWNNGSTSQILTINSSGIYSVTVTDRNGCTNSTSIEVIVNPLPALDLGPDIDICEGDSAYILDAGLFDSYLWSDGSTNRTLEVSADGLYSVTVINTFGCAASDSVSVTVLSLPDAYFYYDVNALEVQFVNNSFNADSHYWDFGDGTSSKEANPIHNYASKGTYAVTYAALSEYCVDSVFTKTVNVGGKSTSEIIDIYPNPSTGKFTILISPNEPILGAINILIHSISGQFLYSGSYDQSLVTSYNGNYYIDVSIDHFTKGIYIVYINAGNFVGQDKLILKD